jgi:hypothetical protein
MYLALSLSLALSFSLCIFFLLLRLCCEILFSSSHSSLIPRASQEFNARITKELQEEMKTKLAELMHKGEYGKMITAGKVCTTSPRDDSLTTSTFKGRRSGPMGLLNAQPLEMRHRA